MWNMFYSGLCGFQYKILQDIVYSHIFNHLYPTIRFYVTSNMDFVSQDRVSLITVIDLAETLNKGEHPDVVLLDLSEAFD